MAGHSWNCLLLDSRGQHCSGGLGILQKGDHLSIADHTNRLMLTEQNHFKHLAITLSNQHRGSTNLSLNLRRSRHRQGAQLQFSRIASSVC